MVKSIRRCAVSFLAVVLLLPAWGCVRIPESKTVSIYADTSLSPVLKTAARDLKKKDGLTLRNRYGSSDVLEKAAEHGARTDLLLLCGKSPTRTGSYTYGAPAIRTLLIKRKVDNYLNIAVTPDGSVYSAAKLLTSTNYAAAQTVTDFLTSETNLNVWETYGFLSTDSSNM